MNRRMLVAVLAASACVAASPALAGHGRHHHHSVAAKGDPNKGDVWVDNVGQPAGPGHEQDPHLACVDINLWGNGLADPSGTYTIDGWPPTGSKGQAYSSTWSYDTTKGGDQVLSVINVQTLIANAVANGDTPQKNQGFHFKLQFVQDPQKHKTFWVNCPLPTKQPPGGTTGPSGSTGPTGSTITPGGTTVTAPNGQKVSPNGGVNGQAPSTAPQNKKKKKQKVLAKRLRRRRGFTG